MDTNKIKRAQIYRMEEELFVFELNPFELFIETISGNK